MKNGRFAERPTPKSEVRIMTNDEVGKDWRVRCFRHWGFVIPTSCKRGTGIDEVAETLLAV